MGNSSSQKQEEQFYHKKVRWFEAARGGDEEAAASLLEATPVLIAELDPDRRNALHYAAANGHDQVVALLLAARPDKHLELVSAADWGGWIPLHHAASEGYDKIIAQLVAAGSDINAKDRAGQTALHLATEAGKVKAVAQLLEGQPDLSTPGVWTALHSAAKRARGEVIDLLLAANPSLVNAVDPNGHTALHVAATSCNANVVSQLLAAGSTGLAHATAAHCAVNNGFEAIADLVLDHNTNSAFAFDTYGNTLLHLAIKAQCSHQFVTRVWWLYPDALHSLSEENVTPFHLATQLSNHQAVDMFMWRVSVDDLLRVRAEEYKWRFRQMIEAQCAPGLTGLPPDLAATVFEYLDLPRSRHKPD